VLVVIAAILLVGVQLFGIKPYTVLSGSMEPTYHVGSIIYVKKVDPLTLKVGDPITFMINGRTIVTHRIIEVIPDGEDPTVVRFRTQGDNNDTPDGDPVHSKNVIGKPIFTVPLLGYVANYIQNPPGKYVAIITCSVLILLVMFGGGSDEENKDDAKADSEKKDEPQNDEDADNAVPPTIS
jgi:signal peptidase